MKNTETVGKILILSTLINKICTGFMSHLPKQWGDIHHDQEAENAKFVKGKFFSLTNFKIRFPNYLQLEAERRE